MKPVRHMNVLVLVDPEQNAGEDDRLGGYHRVSPDESIDVCVIPSRPGPDTG